MSGPSERGPEPEASPDNVVQLHAPKSPEPEPAEDARASDPHHLAPPSEAELPAALEALLLAADGPVSVARLDGWLGNPGEARVRRALMVLADELEQARRGFKLVQVAKGWQYRTDIRFSRWVQRMRGGRPARLSRAALDTLSVLAYRQPVTRAEVDSLRGVDSGGVLRVLCERGLATVVGRKDAPGRPLLYGTTKAFLSLFGLRDLSELPTLSDLRELQRDDARLPPGAAEMLGLAEGDLDLEEESADFDELEDLDDDENGDDPPRRQTHLFELPAPDDGDEQDGEPG